MNQPQPAPEFSWDASLRQALSALRDCLEEARQNNEPLELLDRDVLLDDLRACYRIISAWPTRQASPALPGIALPAASGPPAALPSAAEPLAASGPPAALPAADSNEDYMAHEDSVSEDDLEQSMGDDLATVDEMGVNSSAAHIEWIVGDPPREEDTAVDSTEEPSEDSVEDTAEDPAEDTSEDPAVDPTEEPSEDSVEDTAEDPAEDTAEDPAEDTAEDPAEDSAEGGAISFDATFSNSETLNADESLLEKSEEEWGHETANEQEATSDIDTADEPETANEQAATIETKEQEPKPAERTQRTEWYAPSLFELSTDHSATTKAQEELNNKTVIDDLVTSDSIISTMPSQQEATINSNSEAAVVGGPSRIEQLIQSSKDGAARLADARLRPVTDIKKGLGLNEKFLLMRSFFNNDAMRFTADLDQLNRLNSLQEAEEMLFGNLLPGRHWDAQSEADLTLFLIIYRRFYAR